MEKESVTPAESIASLCPLDIPSEIWRKSSGRMLTTQSMFVGYSFGHVGEDQTRARGEFTEITQIWWSVGSVRGV